MAVARTLTIHAPPSILQQLTRIVLNVRREKPQAVEESGLGEDEQAKPGRHPARSRTEAPRAGSCLRGMAALRPPSGFAAEDWMMSLRFGS